MTNEVIKFNGIDLLVLEETEDTIFVLAYKLGMESIFDKNTNDYSKSALKTKCENWAKNAGLNIIQRELSLVNMDGSSYGSIMVGAAPLTFDEYRAYGEIIRKHIKSGFWTATGWAKEGWGAGFACVVNSGGTPGTNYYHGSYGFAPAFVLNKSELTSRTLADFTTAELLAEIERRTK